MSQVQSWRGERRSYPRTQFYQRENRGTEGLNDLARNAKLTKNFSSAPSCHPHHLMSPKSALMPGTSSASIHGWISKKSSLPPNPPFPSPSSNFNVEPSWKYHYLNLRTQKFFVFFLNMPYFFFQGREKIFTEVSYDKPSHWQFQVPIQLGPQSMLSDLGNVITFLWPWVLIYKVGFIADTTTSQGYFYYWIRKGMQEFFMPLKHHIDNKKAVCFLSIHTKRK